MCRLYSSPNKFTWIAEVGSDCLLWPAMHSRAPNHGAARKAAGLANRRVQQRRVPQQPAYIAGVKSFTLPKQAQLCCVCLQAQNQAFIGFTVRSSTASAIALKRPLRSGTVDRRAKVPLVFFPLLPRGQPATLNRCCGRKLVVPGVNSKRFFSFQKDFIGAFYGLRRPLKYLPNRPWGPREG